MFASGKEYLWSSKTSFPVNVRVTGRDRMNERSVSKMRPERITSTLGFAPWTASAPCCMYLHVYETQKKNHMKKKMKT